jgi:hypothetical protein
LKNSDLRLATALVLLLSSAASPEDSSGGRPGGTNLNAARLADHLAGARSVTVWAGGDGRERDGGSSELVDVRFQPERGYGYIGGHTGSLQGRKPLGGESAWPAVWRDEIERYSLRVPRGRYLVELLLLETEAGSAGRRVFDVLGEEQPLFEAVDIAAQVGDYTWLVLRSVLPVYDGWLDLAFRATPTGLPPRVSGLRVSRLDASDENGAPVLPAPVLTALAMPHAVGLRFGGREPGAPGADRPISHFAVFRGPTPDGPFEEIGGGRLAVRWYIDSGLPSERTYYYRACRYGLDGRRGLFSEIVEARALEPEVLGLPVYRLEIEPPALAALLESSATHEVPARLSDGSERDYVKVRRDVAQPAHRKKSFFVTLDRERNRLFQERRYVYLSGDVRDPTLLERLVWSRAAVAEKLATPTVRPVVLMVNEAYMGLYFDVEVIDRRFLRRNRLDRSGLLARFDGDFDGAAAEPSWAVQGRKITKNGTVLSLNFFGQEVARVGSPQFGKYLRDNLYLERFLARRALAAVRGRLSVFEAGLHALRDARNGRWEFFAQHSSPAVDVAAKAADTPRAEAWLLGARTPSASAGGWGWSLLERRALHEPDVRLRYLDRVETLVESYSQRFDGWVDDAFAELASAARCDPMLWLSPPALAAFERGPERLKREQASRLTALRSALKMVKIQPESPLVISEVLVVPAQSAGNSGPWVELHNRSPGETVALSDYHLSAGSLTDNLAGSKPFSLGEQTLGSGEYVVVELPPGAPRIRASGGYLSLFRRSVGGGDLVAADTCFYGHSTAGFSYGRRADNGEWGIFVQPSPGMANIPETIAPLPYGFRQGLVEAPSGDLTLWVRPNWRQGRVGEAAITKIMLRYRDEGAAEFAAVPLGWNDKLFRHEVTLEASAERGRTEYFFLASSPEGLEQVYPLVAPTLTFAMARLPKIHINEVLPRPRLSADSPLEFIELYNAGTEPVELGGMYLSDSRRQPTKWRIPDGRVLAPEEFTVFYATNQNTESHTNFRLNNSGEFLGLFGRIEEGNRLIDRLSFRALLPGRSWGRATDGAKGFRMWKDPTPGARNMPKIPQEFLQKK